MSRQIVDAYEALEREFKVSTWTMPRSPGWHRAELESTIRRGERSYPHQFTYPTLPIGDYLAALEAIHRLVTQDLTGGLRSALDADLTDRALWARAVNKRDATTFSQAEGRRNGLPPDHVLDEASRIASSPSPTHSDSDEDEVPAPRMVEVARGTLGAYGLSDWTVETSDDMAARLSVNGTLRRIRIRSGEVFSRRAAERLLIHEIGGHVLRWVNSRRQPEPLAQIRLGSTVPTEEGLALWLEQQFGHMDDAALRTYAARVIAVEAARTHGIIDVVKTAADIVDLKAAIEIGVRVKRGLLDPNDPGGSTKDWGYLGGLRIIQATHEANPDDVWLLQGVKWSVEHLPLVRTLAFSKRIIRPELRPDGRLLLTGAQSD